MSAAYSRAKIAGHPIHPMLVAFPVTFYATSLIGFAVFALRGEVFWWQVGLWSNLAGVISAVLAAVPGLVDWWLGVPARSKAKRTGRWHMLLNVAALALFAANLLLQSGRWQARSASVAALGALRAARGWPEWQEVCAALGLCGLGVALTLAAGLLGWTLVQTHHVGVALTEEQRRLEAPASARRPLIQS
jgi:uncharacterized membrane protein